MNIVNNKDLQYSICMSNYNMAETLESALISILCQLDERYEVVLVDDGSSDKSLREIEHLEKYYDRLRIIRLQRDKRRKLGGTRNLSIDAARGKYCILHIDCDDIWKPFIDSFTRVYHEISKRLGRDDFFLSGQQIQMAPKSLLQANKYRNVYYGEDRLLWSDMAVQGRLYCVDHRIMRERMYINSTKKKLTKKVSSLYSFLSISIGSSPAPYRLILKYYRECFQNFMRGVSSSHTVLLLLILPFSIVTGLTKNRFPLISQTCMNYREMCLLDLGELEKLSVKQYGRFSLSMEEREIFGLQDV